MFLSKDKFDAVRILMKLKLIYFLWEAVLIYVNNCSKQSSVLTKLFISLQHVLIVCSEERLHTYVYCQDTLDGSVCQYAGATKLPYGQKPLLMYNGEVSCQTLTGKVCLTYKLH